MNHFLRSSLASLGVLSILLCSCTSSTENLTSESLNDFCTETATESPRLPAGDVLALAQSEDGDPEAYQFTTDKGADIIPIDDNKSYVVWWQPENFNPKTDTVLVALHGHGSWAVKDFEVWYPEITTHHLAYLGLQWWFGRSLESEGYYEPDQIYKLIAEQLDAKGITPGNVIFEGFSMGSARSYGVSLYDHLCGKNYFGINIANAGPWEDDYPLYEPILAGDYGESPFKDTKWILFCGDKDENAYAVPTYSHVCTGMEHTQETLTHLGATVEAFLKDPLGDHGSFMINKENVEEALDKAEEITIKE